MTAPLARRHDGASAPGALQAWIKSSAPNVDLQVTISEVRPDGKETFVQNGWLRANGRKLDRSKSTLLEPVPEPAPSATTGRCPAASWAEITVPLYYQGHVYRAGSRIRITIRRRAATSRSGRSPTRSRRGAPLR